MISWFTGDVFDGLATLDDESIDLVVTSPPFLALRSYLPADHPDKDKEIGSEATPAEFLDVMLAVTAELRRVLAPHGSIAVELGDTYSMSGGAGGDYGPGGLRDGQPKAKGSASRKKASGNAWGGQDGFGQRWNPGPDGPPANGGDGWPLAKSKTLIPELYRIALAYGFNPLTGEPSPAGRWRVRNVVTWCRPNPPVGALGDKWRPATSDVVVACVSGKRYWDDLATRRPRSAATLERDKYDRLRGEALVRNPSRGDYGDPTGVVMSPGGAAPLLDYWEIPLLDDEEPRPYGPTRKDSNDEDFERKSIKQPRSWDESGVEDRSRGLPTLAKRIRYGDPAGAPLLDYWEIPPTGYSGAHYAVYPPALVEPLVKAMVPEKVCRTCGEPSRRIVETFYIDGNGRPSEGGRSDFGRGGLGPNIGENRLSSVPSSLGFTDCGHDDWRPGIVLDPFAGSGTTLAVASGHGHDAIGFDLDPRNEELARERVGPLLWQEV